MKLQLLEILESFGYPVRLQGSFAPDEPYPPTFLTYWNGNTSDGAHYDNDAIAYVWDFTVYVYSDDPTTVNTLLLSVKDELKKSGWIVGGKGYDVPTDYPSHTGRAIDALYIERGET